MKPHLDVDLRCAGLRILRSIACSVREHGSTSSAAQRISSSFPRLLQTRCCQRISQPHNQDHHDAGVGLYDLQCCNVCMLRADLFSALDNGQPKDLRMLRRLYQTWVSASVYNSSWRTAEFDHIMNLMTEVRLLLTASLDYVLAKSSIAFPYRQPQESDTERTEFLRQPSVALHLGNISLLRHVCTNSDLNRLGTSRLRHRTAAEPVWRNSAALVRGEV